MTLSPPNLAKLLAPVAVFAALLAVLLVANRGDGPTLPAVADPGAPTGDPVRDFQRAVRADPASAAAYAGLGQAYLSRARETGDPSFLARAERAFDAALRRDPRDLAALTGAGALAGQRHDFGGQLRLGRAAVSVAPALARPYTVLADAQLELGRYEAAARSIQRLLDIKPGLPAYSRASYYRELSGDLPGAVEAMRLAASAGGTAENQAYVQALLGDLELVRGRAAAARAAYTASLRSLPGHPAGLVGLARVDAAGGEPGRAAARLRRAAERLPLTGTLVLLSEVERRLGRPEAAEAALAGARAQHQLLRGTGTRPDAEAVIFEAEHGSAAEAVRLGRLVWEAAPSVRSADALGWALTRAGRPAAGYAFARRALALGSRDPAFRLHAGIAARVAGLEAAAARHLSVAKAGRAALSPAAAERLAGALSPMAAERLAEAIR
jgi:tetratricopeptide (TPR) repeat protein